MPAFDDDADVTFSTGPSMWQQDQSVREQGLHRQRRLEVVGEFVYLAIITHVAYRQWTHLTYKQLDEVRRRLATSKTISDISIEKGLDYPVMAIPEDKHDRPTPVDCFYTHVGYHFDVKGFSAVTQWVERQLGSRLKKTVEGVLLEGNGKSPDDTASMASSSSSSSCASKRPFPSKQPEPPAKKQCLQSETQLVQYHGFHDPKFELEKRLLCQRKSVEWRPAILGQSGPWQADCFIDGKLASTGNGQKKMDAMRNAAMKALAFLLTQEAKSARATEVRPSQAQLQRAAPQQADPRPPNSLRPVQKKGFVTSTQQSASQVGSLAYIEKQSDTSELLKYDSPRFAALRQANAGNKGTGAKAQKLSGYDVILKDKTNEVGNGGMRTPLPPLQTPTTAESTTIRVDAEPSGLKTLQIFQQDGLQRHGSSLMDKFKQWIISTGKSTSIIYTEKLIAGTSVWRVECLVDGHLVGHSKGYGALAGAMKEAAMTATMLVARLKVHETEISRPAKSDSPSARFQVFDAGECIV